MCVFIHGGSSLISCDHGPQAEGELPYKKIKRMGLLVRKFEKNP